MDVALAVVQSHPVVVMQVVMLDVRRQLVAVRRRRLAAATLAVQPPVVAMPLLPAVVNQLAARNAAVCCLACSLARSLATAAVQNRAADATAAVQLLADVLRNRLAVATLAVQLRLADRVVQRQHLLLRLVDAERALPLAQLLSTRHRLLNLLPLNRFLPILRLPFREVFAFDKHLTRFASVDNIKQDGSDLVSNCSN
ncbi:MAG: hypothetical protein R3C28_04105 [Pirellulaceae bacterium]